MAEKWEVWAGEDNPRDLPFRVFRSFAAAERYARQIVAASSRDRFAVRIEITRNLSPVATVRLDPLDRVWTDVEQTALV